MTQSASNVLLREGSQYVEVSVGNNPDGSDDDQMDDLKIDWLALHVQTRLTRSEYLTRIINEEKKKSFGNN